VGPVITDETISLDSVMSGFLLPEPATERPPYVPLAIEWPPELVATLSDNRKVTLDAEAYALFETEFSVTSFDSTAPLRFDVVTPSWRLPYEYAFDADRPPTIRPLGRDAVVKTLKGEVALSAFLTSHGLLVTFEDEIILVEQGFLLKPKREHRLYPVSAVEALDWTGIDITKESQGRDRSSSTVQFRAIEALAAEKDWEVVLDDDGTGELADIVLMRRLEDRLEVLFAHCKYSSESKPGARIGDLYEVCGQAMKMNRARSLPDLLTRRLLRREQDRQAAGWSGLVVGEVGTLAAIVRESRVRLLEVTVAVVQPGLSRARVSEDMRALLGGTERYLNETYAMRLRVLGSE
jgi:hypothetical protein